MRNNRLLEKLIASVQVERLDRRIYNILLLIASCAGPLVIIGNILQGLHILAIVNPVIITSVIIYLYYLSIVKNLMYKFFLCFIFLVFTAVQWIYNGGGSTGGMQYFFMWTFISATILIRGRALVLYVVLNSLVLLGLLTYEFLDGSYIIQYSDDTSRYIDVIISASLTFILASLMIRVIYNEIDKERLKSEQLLLNILPQKIISELKEKGRTSPEIFSDVTVIFSDIVGFTEISTKLPVEILISELNEIFTMYDTIIEKNNCERIKTIGDAYLAVCGLPEYNQSHCENAVRAAIEMLQYIESRNRVHQNKWEIRIGIHTGHVIGSVVGIKKYIYDVFGDTVNTASRLESLSEPMKINISMDVMKNLNGSFRFEDRGLIKVKGKTEMNMFYVTPTA